MQGKDGEGAMDVTVGDIWKCGKHYIACGDCRDVSVWSNLLYCAGIDTINGCITSPPYAMQRKNFYGGVPENEYIEWFESVQENIGRYIAEDGSFFLNIKEHAKDGQRVLYCKKLVIAMVEQLGWRFVDELMWLHQGFPGKYKCRFKSQFEPIYHFSKGWPVKFFPKAVSHQSNDVPWRDPKDYKSCNEFGVLVGPSVNRGSGMALPGNVIRISQGTSKIKHAAVFPVALPEFFIKAFSEIGDAWLDPFCGSGTTIVAAIKTQRVGLGIELLPRYVQLTLDRLREIGLEPIKVK